jgi:hypothetical protein
MMAIVATILIVVELFPAKIEPLNWVSYQT